MAGNVIQLTIRVDDKGKPVVETFVRDTKKGMTEVEKSSTGVTSAMGNLKKAAGAALTALAAVGGAALTAATSGLALARNTAQAGDQAYVLGQQLGVTAEKASELDYWARSNGSSTEAMAASMRALALSAAQAAAGSKQDVAAFKAIGLSVNDVNPSLHSMDEIFRTVVGAMDRYAESGHKTAAGTVILGRGFTELKPALAGGVKGMDDAARAGRVLGVIFTNDAANAAHELNNSFDDLRAAIRGVTNAIGVNLFPMVKSAVDATSKWIKENKDLIATKVEKFIKGVVDAGKVLGPIIRGAAGATLELLDRLTKVNPELLQFAAGTAAVVGGAGLATSGLKSFVESATKVVDTSLNVVANFKAINAGSMLAKAGLTSLSVAGFAAVASAGGLLVLKIQELNKELGELAEQSSKYLAGIQALNPELRTLTMTQSSLQLALSRNSEALQKQKDRLASANSATRDQSQAAAEAKAEIARLEKEHASLSSALDRATQKLQDYGKGQKGAAALTVEVADATIKETASHKENVGAMDASGDAASKAAEANKRLRDSIEGMHLDALADDIDDATRAMERSKTVVADENYLRALQDIQAAFDAQVAAGKRATEEAVQAGADRELAAQAEAATVSQAQRDMAAAVESLNEPLQKNQEYWDGLGQQILEMPDEVRALIPTLDAVAAATGHVDEATFGMVEATKEVSPAAVAASGTISDLSKAILGLLDGTSKATDVVKTFAGGLVDNLGQAVSSALGSSSFGKSVTDSLSGVFGPALGSAIATAGMSAVVQIGAGIFMSGVKDALEGEATSAAAKIGLVVGGPIGAAIGVGIVAAFGIGHQSMVERIAAELAEMFKAALDDPEITQAIDDGLQAVGLFLGAGLAKQMIRAPKDMGADVTAAWKKLGTDSSYQFSEGFYQDMKEKGTQLIHSSIADVLHVFFPEITNDVAVGIQQSAVAAGAAMARELGLVGDKAIKFANQWSVAFIGMMQQAGKGADEILVALHRIDASIGTSQELVGSLQRLQAELIESGVDMDALYSKINEQLRTITGKKVKVGNLDEVLAAVGGDAERALGVIENAMDLAGISIERFSGQLSDVVLAISGDAGTAIREAGQDFRDFGSDADGTAEILRQKVLTALDDVISTAEELGYSAESIDAFKTAVSLIPPEMLRSSEFTNQLRQDFARMAAESHVSVRELVDSIDPPLPAAVREAILSVDALGTAIGALSGAPLRSLKEVTDRMKQFSGELYVWVEENGKQVQKLTTFGEQVVGDVVSAVNGMWNTINEDSWVGLDEVGKAFAELGNIPAEALNDPAIQSAMKSLLAKLGEALGDAELISMANADVITSDMIAEATKRYDEYVQHIEDNPPEVPPPTTTDGQPVTDENGQPTGPDTSAATSAPPPPPVPADTLQSWADLTEEANAFGAAAKVNTDAVAGLAEATKLSSATILAAIQPIIGTVGDGRSLTDLYDLFGLRLPQVVDELTQDILGATGVWKGSFDFARGAVEQLTGSVDALKTSITEVPRDITITTHYVSDGTPPTGGGSAGDGIDGQGHTGAIVPGYPSTSERLYKVLPGEVLIPPDHDLSAAIRAAGSIESGIASFTAGRAPGRGTSSPATPSVFSDGGGGRSAGDVAGEVVSRLTNNGQMVLLVVPKANYRELERSVLLDGLPRLSAAGAVKVDPRTGVIKRSSSIPGPG